jgi:hypothetical protein
VKQVVTDFMSDRESLPDKSVSRVVSYRPPILFDHEHAGDIVSESFGLNREIETVSENFDRNWNAIGVCFAERSFSLFFELFSDHGLS